MVASAFRIWDAQHLSSITLGLSHNSETADNVPHSLLLMYTLFAEQNCDFFKVNIVPNTITEVRHLISALQLPTVLWGQRDMEKKKKKKMTVGNTLRHVCSRASEEIAPIQLMWETSNSSPNSSIKDTGSHLSAFAHTSNHCPLGRGPEEKSTQGLGQQKALNTL